MNVADIFSVSVQLSFWNNFLVMTWHCENPGRRKLFNIEMFVSFGR